MPKNKKKDFKKIRARREDLALLEWRILDTARYYIRLTVRQLYYIMTSRFGYTPSRKFYKLLDRTLTKMRRLSPTLNAKFRDPTRRFIRSPMPYREIELWVEKDSICYFLGDLARRFRLSIQVLKGFASLTMYREALQRAKKQGVKRILYIGDFNPSGLLIDRIAEKEMGIKINRIALTMEQIKTLKPPSIKVNRRDSRAPDFIRKYGNRCWEVEALRPRTFHKLIKEKLKEHVPPEYLAEAYAWERAARIARPFEKRLGSTIQSEIFHLLEEGKSQEEILTQLTSKYGSLLKRQRAKRSKTT